MMVQVNTTTLPAGSAAAVSAYDPRTAQSTVNYTAQASQNVPRQTMPDVVSDEVNVQLSQESQEFLDSSSAQKAAAAGSTQSAAASNPFDGTGSLKKQFEVFSQSLSNSGFYDNMTDQAIREVKQLLRDITSSMDAIAPDSYAADMDFAPSGAGAQVALASSVEALHQFADQNLEGDAKDNFEKLISSYETHNRPIVDRHRNVRDRMDKALAQFTQSRFYTQSGKSLDPSRSVAAKLGSIQHTAEQNRKMREATTTAFREIRKGTMSVSAAISKAQGTFLSYASEDRQDGEMRSLLIQRNSAVFAQMSAYWGVLMRA